MIGGEQQIQIELPKVSYFIEDIEQENIGDVYALIYGTAELNNGQSLSDGIYFEYSSDNDLNKTIQAQLVDGKWMAQLENLSPATKYKVWFKGNEETVKEFTTESVTLEPSPWAYFAFLYGKYSKAGEEVKFEYKSSSSSWIQVPAILRTDGTYYASISGLIPGGEYQYRLVTTEGMEGNIVSFKAEEELQLPNAGFENWQKPKNPWLIYGTDEDIFWDSGNHGATTLSASGSVTTPVESPKHSGVYAAQLKSRGVWALFSTIFAGGNMFTGEYIGTSGTSGAILDFGRPFETRPSKLTGWYKYAPGVIDYSNTSGMSDELKSEGVAKGDTDKAHIWVVLGNWTVAEGQKGPVRINNASRPGGLYDYKTDENVIAYGELVQTTATSDDNLIPFEIKLNYFNLERKPTHIIIVCSASKYADYFTGSTSSTLWLDDFELIYDDSPLTN